MTADQPTQPLDLDAIRARAAHVIAGPWTVGEPKCVDEVDAWEIPIRLPSAVDGNPDEQSELAVVRYQTAGFQYPHAEAMADAEFVAAARTDIPALLAEMERLRALLEPARDTSQPTPPFPLAEDDTVTVTMPARVAGLPDPEADPGAADELWDFALTVAGETEYVSLTQAEVIARVRKP